MEKPAIIFRIAKWPLGLASAVVVGILVEKLKGYPLVQAAQSAAYSTWAFLGTGVSLPRWVFVCWLLVSVVAVIGVVVAWLASLNEPTFHDYTADRILGIDWEWRYLGNRIDDDSLRPFCPKCRYQLKWIDASTYHGTDYRLSCDHCGWQTLMAMHQNALIERVVGEIDLKLRTGEYAKAKEVSRTLNKT